MTRWLVQLVTGLDVHKVTNLYSPDTILHKAGIIALGQGTAMLTKLSKIDLKYKSSSSLKRYALLNMFLKDFEFNATKIEHYIKNKRRIGNRNIDNNKKQDIT